MSRTLGGIKSKQKRNLWTCLYFIKQNFSLIIFCTEFSCLLFREIGKTIYLERNVVWVLLKILQFVCGSPMDFRKLCSWKEGCKSRGQTISVNTLKATQSFLDRLLKCYSKFLNFFCGGGKFEKRNYAIISLGVTIFVTKRVYSNPSAKRCDLRNQFKSCKRGMKAGSLPWSLMNWVAVFGKNWKALHCLHKFYTKFQQSTQFNLTVVFFFINLFIFRFL